MPSHPALLVQLSEFLHAYFQPPELAELLELMGHARVLRNLPPARHSSPAEWFHAAIETLERHGLIHLDLLRALADLRPARHAEVGRIIALVRRLEGASRLPATDLERLLEAALAAGLDAWEAQFALQEQTYPDEKPRLFHRRAPANLRATLEELNRETDPDLLLRWITAARGSAGSAEAKDVFALYSDILQPPTAASDAPVPTPPSSPPHDVGELRHQPVIQRLVPFSYLADGHAAGAAVASVRFLEHRGGVPVLTAGGRFQGTGVLVAPKLLMTSWYLARAASLAPERDEDFLRQCRTASFRFDVDDTHPHGGLVLSGGAVAWCRPLNVVLLRIEDDLQREPAVLRTAPLHTTPRTLEGGEQVQIGSEPLSVIQHPLAGMKRVCLRDLRDYRVDRDEADYLGECRAAFAGAPWYDDAWRVVALQGKVDTLHHGPRPGVLHTATLVTAILDVLRRGEFDVPPGGRHADVWAELSAAQARLGDPLTARSPRTS